MNLKLTYCASLLLIGCTGMIASGQAQTDTQAQPLSGLSFVVKSLNGQSRWEQIAAIPLQFKTHHPQGMVKIGDTLYLSSVEVKTKPEKYPTPQDGYDRNTGAGIGHLFKMDMQGNLLDSVTLGEGTIYHPGGIDYDGENIWVPVAEYRPNSSSIIYKVDPKTLKPTEVFRYKDHIGGIVHNTESNALHGISWGSRRFYDWAIDKNGQVAPPLENSSAPAYILNPSHYIDYQDCHYMGQQEMLCSGLSNYKSKDSEFSLGGLEIVNLKDHRVSYQLPVEHWSPVSGLPMTQNPFWVEENNKELKAYFIPDDDQSVLYIYKITP